MQIKELIKENKHFVFKAVLIFILVLLVSGGMRGHGKRGFQNNNERNTITVSGHGEVNAVPDIATISFGVEASKNTQKESSDEVNTKTKKVLDFLKSSQIDSKDIKTDNYNSYPKYNNPEPCPVYYSGGIMPPCRTTEAKIIGYTVSQNITVKVRKVDDVSKIIDGINAIGVTNMYGPTLSVDDEEGLKVNARKLAIDNAKEKAKVLSKDLGVRLIKITAFNETGNYYPMYATGSMMKDSVSNEASVPSEIPKGENTVSSDVSITYEIR
ncbi:MAG: SIMPL domain-containing protein [Patescibacteria group bacterium]|mgnify:CR=1 FL=1